MHEFETDPATQHHSLSIQGNKMHGQILESIDQLAYIADNVYLKKVHLVL